MKMPFGKYRGLEISNLPSNYLDWLLTIDLHGRLLEAVEAEWMSRDADEGHETPPVPPHTGLDAEERLLLMEVVRAGYRALARKYHPDLEGGNPEMMVRLNRLMERLKDMGGL